MKDAKLLVGSASLHFLCSFGVWIVLAFHSMLHADNRKNQWEKTEFVWGAGMIVHCDVGANSYPIQFFETETTSSLNPQTYAFIKSGDIVWLPCRLVKEFYRQVLPHVQQPFVLVLNQGDPSFPSESGLSPEEIELLFASDKIIHIFARNCDRPRHPKISLIPIGLDYHTIAYKGEHGGWGEAGTPAEQERQLKFILQGLSPTHLRKKRAFVDFQLADTMRGEHRRDLQFGEDRTSIFRRLLATGLVDYGPWMRRSQLWTTKGQYAFSISPPGNGLDCHRTWEDLILGCIVIVRSSTIDALYEGLPVVIVKDWSEVTTENMELWLEQYKDAFTNPAYREKLTAAYWIKMILEKAAPYRSES
jgi:hypothetical protein